MLQSAIAAYQRKYSRAKDELPEHLSFSSNLTKKARNKLNPTWAMRTSEILLINFSVFTFRRCFFSEYTVVYSEVL